MPVHFFKHLYARKKFLEGSCQKFRTRKTNEGFVENIKNQATHRDFQKHTKFTTGAVVFPVRNF